MEKVATLVLTKFYGLDATHIGFFNIPIKYIRKTRQMQYNVQLTQKGKDWVKRNCCKDYDAKFYRFEIVNRKFIKIPTNSLEMIETIVNMIKSSQDCCIKGSELVYL